MLLTLYGPVALSTFLFRFWADVTRWRSTGSFHRGHLSLLSLSLSLSLIDLFATRLWNNALTKSALGRFGKRFGNPDHLDGVRRPFRYGNAFRGQRRRARRGRNRGHRHRSRGIRGSRRRGGLLPDPTEASEGQRQLRPAPLELDGLYGYEERAGVGGRGPVRRGWEPREQADAGGPADESLLDEPIPHQEPRERGDAPRRRGLLAAGAPAARPPGDESGSHYRVVPRAFSEQLSRTGAYPASLLSCEARGRLSTGAHILRRRLCFHLTFLTEIEIPGWRFSVLYAVSLAGVTRPGMRGVRFHHEHSAGFFDFPVYLLFYDGS